MDLAKNLFTTLQNPNLVANFQRACGIEGHISEDKNCKYSTYKYANGINHFGVDHQNNHARISPKHQNGHVLTEKLNGYGCTVEDLVKRKKITHEPKSNGASRLHCECEVYQNGVTHTGNGEATHVTDSHSATLDKHVNSTQGKASHGELTKDVTNILEPEHWTNTEFTYDVKYNYLYYLFKLAAGLGNETFFTLLFPYVIFNMDSCIGRRICLVWCYIMFIGQATKDLIKLPRPSSPPVVRLEKRYEYEFGMPSTHAMIGAAVPFALLTLIDWRYPNEFPYSLALIGAFIWMCLVAVSRIYLGMHTILDVIAGLAYTTLILPPYLPMLEWIDWFAVTYRYAPLVTIPVTVAMCLTYPKLECWSTTRGDTTVVLATGVGMCLGTWLDYQLGRATVPIPPPYAFNMPELHEFLVGLLRMLVGSIVIWGTRMAMKPVVISCVCRLLGVDKTDVTTLQQLKVELPYKYITYSCLAFSATFIACNIFSLLGIERDTYLTEIALA